MSPPSLPPPHHAELTQFPTLMADAPRVSIMGIRGVPAGHGGFETFAARLGPWLAERGWRVTVYCHEDDREPPRESQWQAVRRVHIGSGPDTPLTSIQFDWACISHAVREKPPLVLTLGYNTALFGLRLRLAGIPNLINMDGLEWTRAKWGPMARAWLYANDWAGCLIGDHLIADHPQIARHLATRVDEERITMIPYGTDQVQGSDPAPLAALGLAPGSYLTLIARPEPENSVLEIVRAFSARPRGVRLVVLGKYVPAEFAYHRQVQEAASPEVMFPGAIYDGGTLDALREYGLAYLHGHQVGGTNPSLLEAMGAGNAVIAHDNRFNRWVVGEGALFFNGVEQCDQAISTMLAEPLKRRFMADLNRTRAANRFNWPLVLSQYEQTMQALHDRARGRAQPGPLPFAGRLDT